MFLMSTFLVNSQNVEAKLVTKTVDNFVDIKGIATNLEATYNDELNYLLFSLKKGITGNYSRNSQEGKFSLNPNEEKELSSLSLNIQKGEECKVYLFVRKNKELISKDSTIIYSAEKLEEKAYVEESEIEIKGLVIEDVKTKPGKDFYDYFYQKYLTSGAQYPFIVNITEKPSIGTSSKITITVDDRVIFEFMSRPSDEYIEMAATQALSRIRGYSTQRKLLYKNKKI